MNSPFTLRSPEFVETLRSIEPTDLEDLRTWKNANTAAFFFKGSITPKSQIEWFEGYVARPEDYMFLVGSEGLRAGCMGFRLEAGMADGYNVIGAPADRGRGILGRGMRLMCSYVLAEHTRRIGCRVLKENPAVGWYQKCGYRIAADRGDHVQMELDLSRFVPCAYTKQHDETRTA